MFGRFGLLQLLALVSVFTPLLVAANTCDRTDIGPGDVQHNCTRIALTDPQVLLALPPFSADLEPNRTHHIIYDDQLLQQVLQPLPATSANIITFSCRRCNLTHLANAAFAAISHIRLLDLSDNALNGDQLRSAIWHASNINVLLLSDNHIDALPEDSGLSGIVGLERLDLSRNRLVNLAALLAAMSPTLQFLNVSGNALVFGEDDAGKEGVATLPQLLELDLRNNSFVAVPRIVSGLGATLHTLTIGGGGLQRLGHSDGIRGLTALNTLNVLGDGDSAATPLIIEADSLQDLGQLQLLRINGNRGLHTLNVTGLLAANGSLHTIELLDNGLTTVQLNWTAPVTTSASNETPNPVAFGALRLLRLAGNPWHCDCALYGALTHIMRPQPTPTQRFDSEYNARCRTPHSVATDFLVDLLVDAKRAGCAIRNVHKEGRVELPYEPPAFLRPRQLLLSVLSVVVVVLLGIGIGAAIVVVQRRLRAGSSSIEGGVLQHSPVQYTTVRNSTMVPVARQSVRLSWPAQLQQMEMEQRQRERDQQLGVSERPLRPLRPGAKPEVMESFGG